jgi:iron-sulfur cluster assembly protein
MRRRYNRREAHRPFKERLLRSERFHGGFMVTLSDIAANKVKELMNGQADNPEAGLRVAVRGGGCSGFQYALAFDEQREGDEVFEHQEIRLLVDSESLPFVDGSEVDYVESLQGAGFSVNNPNVVASCGCGQSFKTA